MDDALLSRLTTRALLSLPGPLLRALSGGRGFEAGRTLDPRLHYLASLSRRLPPACPLVARRRTARLDALLLGRPEPTVRVERLSLPGPAGALEARLHRPSRLDRAEGLLLWFPSGGGVAAGLHRDEALCSMLAHSAHCLVLAVQPRLAPETRAPAQLDDALAAYRWARTEANRLGAPCGQVAVGGADFGGGLAAAVCQALRTAGEPQPPLQLLVSPWLDMASETQSITLFADAWPLSSAETAWRAEQLLGSRGDRFDPRVSPIKCPDLTGLADAVVVTSGFDPLVDQGEAYAKRLTDAGGAVFYRCYDRLTHDFHAMTAAAPCAELACREIGGLLREGLQHRVAAAEA